MNHGLYAASITIEAAAAVIISRYTTEHSPPQAAAEPTTENGSVGDHIWKDWSTAANLYLHHTTYQTLLDPTPTVFISALSAFTLAVLYNHHLHRRHRLQNHFLLVGTWMGIGIGIAAASMRAGGTDAAGLVSLAQELQRVLPWTVLFASMTSAVVHWIVGGGIILAEDEAGDGSEGGGVEVGVDKRERKGGKFAVGKKRNWPET